MPACLAAPPNGTFPTYQFRCNPIPSIPVVCHRTTLVTLSQVFCPTNCLSSRPEPRAIRRLWQKSQSLAPRQTYDYNIYSISLWFTSYDVLVQTFGNIVFHPLDSDFPPPISLECSLLLPFFSPPFHSIPQFVSFYRFGRRCLRQEAGG